MAAPYPSPIHALRATRVFRPGQVALWNPPAGAYSPTSAQQNHARQKGIVQAVYRDSYVTLRFSDNAIVLLSTDYLEAQ